MLPNNPKLACISELLTDLDHWVGQLKLGRYGSDEMLFWLVAKILRDLWDVVWLWQNARQGPSRTRTCLSFYWSWHWRRRVTSSSTPTAPGEATLGTMAVDTKDLDLDKGLPLRMLTI